MGKKPEEIIRDSIFMLDIKLSEKDEKGNVTMKARPLAELAQALRDMGY